MWGVDGLSGFGFTGFRSFYGESQLICPLTDVNLIAGQNNSGKSNVLRVVNQMRELIDKGPEGLNIPQVPAPPAFDVVVRLGDRATVHSEFCEAENLTNDQVVSAARRILGDPAFDITDDGSVWLRFSNPSPNNREQALYKQSVALSEADARTRLATFLQNTGRSYSNDPRVNATEFLRLLRPRLKIPTVQFVDASRRIEDEIGDTTLIERLARLQNPDVGHNDDRERFAAINRFLQSVTDDPTARLEVPYPATGLNVWRGDLLLPLENLGTGIAQVVMLAAWATLESNTVVCIEEPEVHLHPLLQRKLIRYLKEETRNQYLIATHSAHLLDSATATVYHAKYTDDGTEITLAGTPADLSEICYDLGYRPSDLLQTNCVIWVEGPSDRTYIAHWLSLMNPKLQEGIHYSIMFYGGRLLNHLSADDPEITEFIKLRRLNRHLAVVMDSDRASRYKRIGSTKARIQKEIEEWPEHGIAWVTEGRYIESYVPRDALTKLLGQLYEDKVFIENVDKYSNALRLTDEESKWIPDKIRIAKAVRQRWKSGLHSLNLYSQIEALAELIETANGHEDDIPDRPAKTEPSFDWD